MKKQELVCFSVFMALILLTGFANKVAAQDTTCLPHYQSSAPNRNASLLLACSDELSRQGIAGYDCLAAPFPNESMQAACGSDGGDFPSEINYECFGNASSHPCLSGYDRQLPTNACRLHGAAVPLFDYPPYSTIPCGDSGAQMVDASSPLYPSYCCGFIPKEPDLLSSSVVYAVGNNGLILRFNGNDWEKIDSNTHKDLYAVEGFYGNDNVLVAGQNHTLLQCSSGGCQSLESSLKWTASDARDFGFNSAESLALRSAWVGPRNPLDTYYVVGDRGVILHPSVNGIYPQGGINVASDLYSVWGLPGTKDFEVYAVGGNSTVMRYYRQSDSPPYNWNWNRVSVSNSAPGDTYYAVHGTNSNNVLIAGQSASGGAVLVMCRVGQCARFEVPSEPGLHAARVFSGTDAFLVAGQDSRKLLHYGGDSDWKQVGDDSMTPITALWGRYNDSFFAAGYRPSSLNVRGTDVISYYDGTSWRAWPTEEKINALWGPDVPVLQIVDVIPYLQLLWVTAKFMGANNVADALGHEAVVVQRFYGNSKHVIPTRTPSPTPTPTPAPVSTTIEQTFVVDARENQMWGWGGGVDTGIDLHDGDVMEFTATGEWYIGENGHERIPNDGFVNMGTVSPDGSPDYLVWAQENMAAGEPVHFAFGALVGSMGIGQYFFLIGSHRTKTVQFDYPDEVHRLYLYCSDDSGEDNYGTVTVHVRVTTTHV